MRVLVTGGAGFIGSNLAEALAEDEKNQVLAVDNLLTGNKKYLPKKDNLSFIKANVNKRTEVPASGYHQNETIT